jgi:uncharacterized repeat protein (TIGR01451 family)
MKMQVLEQRNFQRFSTLLLIFFFVGFVLLLGLPQSVHAETITVTNTLDDDSVGSLRYAIITGTVSGDTIVFDVTGTIVLTQGTKIDIVSKTLTLEGPGAMGLAISGDSRTRILDVASSGALTLTNLTLRNGNAGTGYGGGLRSYGPLTVRDCIFRGNAASMGAALYANGSTTLIEDTAFYTNTASFTGAGLYVGRGTATLTNVTFSGNDATTSGSALTVGNVPEESVGTALLNFVTIAENTTGNSALRVTLPDGAIGLTPTLTIRNSIISRGTETAACNVSGTMINGGGNLANDASCSGFTESASLNLGAVADNGGSTWTHALQSGSPAIDAVPLVSCTVATDQRGVARPQGDACDSGAYERALLLKTVNATTPAPGERITYTLALHNSDAFSYTQAVISDTLPDGLTFVGPVVLEPSGAGTVGTPPVLVSELTILPGTGITVTFPVDVDADVTLGTPLTNTAAFTSAETASPLFASTAVEVVAADLVLTKTAFPEPAVAGTALTYTLSLVNQGNATATDIVLSDTFHLSTTLQTLDQTDNTEAEFLDGSLSNLRWDADRPNRPEWLALADIGLGSGTFESRVMDALNVATWTTLSWESRRPTWKALPDNGGSEEYYALGNAVMVGNRLLLHLDEAAGATTFVDDSGVGNDGTCPATTGEACPTAGGAGRFTNGLSFDGASSQTVVVADAEDPVRYALETWVYPQVVTDTSFILRTDTTTDTLTRVSHLLGIMDGHFVHGVYDGAFKVVTSTVEVTPDTWYHVVGTAESDGDIKLYVNGALEGKLDGIGTLWEGGDAYRLGSTYGEPGTASYYTGGLDEVAVYTRTLSAAEVTDHYLRGALRLGFQVRSCTSPDCSDGTFVGPDGTAGTVFSEQSYSGVGWPGYPSFDFTGLLAANRYFQYRAAFESDTAEHSPELSWVAVGPAHPRLYTSQGTCTTPDDETFTCSLGDLAPGAALTVTAHMNVHESMLGVITNTAAVTTTTPIASPDDDTTFVTSTVNSEVYLSIYKYDDDDDTEWEYGASDPVNPGSPMTYTLEVHNGGPSTAWDVMVTDTLPITVTGVSAVDNWAVCQQASDTITCTADALGAYSWRHIVITGTAPAVEGTITNTAWITATASTVYATSHLSDSESTLITPLADLLITKVADRDLVDPGAVLTYTITVTNTGPYTATGVIVQDGLVSGGVIGYPVAGSEWNCSTPDIVVFCELVNPLPALQSASFALTATAPVSGLIVNMVGMGLASPIDPNSENNEAVSYVAVRPVADLHISKYDSPDPVNAAEPLTYTLLMTNTGYVTAGARQTDMSLDNYQTISLTSWRSGRARPYPSSIYLSNLEGTIRTMTVTLRNVTHTYPADMEVLLVGPGGRTAVLMANAGGGVDMNDVTLTFNDAGVSLPLSGTITSTVVYRPTNYGISGSLPQAPEEPYGGSLSSFYGTSPNGLWQLYVHDTFYSDGGEIANGWQLQFTTRTTETVTVSDLLPETATGPVMVDAPAGWTAISSDPLTYEADMLPVGVPTVFTLTVTAPITAGVITNTASITSTTADFWPDSNTDMITTTVLGVSDLSITKQVLPTPAVGAGLPLTYTLTISNAGPSAAQGPIVVTDILPDGVTGVAAPGCVVSASPLVTCTLGGLAMGGVEVVTITVSAPITPGVITNTAAVTATAIDPDPLNNSAFVTVTVTEQADLAVVKTAEPALVAPGDVLTYTVTVTNLGPTSAPAVTVTDTVINSQGIPLLGAGWSSTGLEGHFGIQDTAWSCARAGGVFTCTVANLPVGVATPLVFTVTVPSVLGHAVITNTAVVASSEEDLNLTNNTAVVTTPVALRPVANAGADQSVPAGATVTLNGSASYDPDGDTPLSFGWLQIGGPAVTLSSATVVSPTFTAPGAPTVLTFTLRVTDALGLGCTTADTVVVTVTNAPITGLTATNDSPTTLGNETHLVAHTTGGTGITYVWNFGDGVMGTGNPVTHTYPMSGTYTAVVTATNSLGTLSATTVVTIVEPTGSIIYLPLVMNNYSNAPDLVVTEVIATRNAITVTVENQGDSRIEGFEQEFWVDVYIDPDTMPVSVNQTWQHVGTQGLVWGVTMAAFPMDPGEEIVLVANSSGSGTYYWPELSQVTWPIPVGTPIWAQVDSAHASTAYGAVWENHERTGGVYNNIRGPVFSTSAGEGGIIQTTDEDQVQPVRARGHLPPRP